mmetsp:Transcript_30267/g.66201  ORF Transcript_30267/g.66201 Transcript_30267/m.66201 type:complete len:208 (+) Transcript_30267:1293-1916(+)
MTHTSVIRRPPRAQPATGPRRQRRRPSSSRQVRQRCLRSGGRRVSWCSWRSARPAASASPRSSRSRARQRRAASVLPWPWPSSLCPYRSTWSTSSSAGGPTQRRTMSRTPQNFGYPCTSARPCSSLCSCSRVASRARSSSHVRQKACTERCFALCSHSPCDFSTQLRWAECSTDLREICFRSTSCCLASSTFGRSSSAPTWRPCCSR